MVHILRLQDMDGDTRTWSTVEGKSVRIMRINNYEISLNRFIGEDAAGIPHNALINSIAFKWEPASVTSDWYATPTASDQCSSSLCQTHHWQEMRPICI